MKCGEMNGNAWAEVLHQPSGHPINALFRIVFSRNEQTGNFCPDIGFIVQIDERVQYGLEMGRADPMIKVLRESL